MSFFNLFLTKLTRSSLGVKCLKYGHWVDGRMNGRMVEEMNHDLPYPLLKHKHVTISFNFTYVE